MLCRYVHVLVQKMAVNVDLGFILSLVDFFSLDQEDLQLEVSAWCHYCIIACYSFTRKYSLHKLKAERVKSDLDFVSKSLKETIVPEV